MASFNNNNNRIEDEVVDITSSPMPMPMQQPIFNNQMPVVAQQGSAFDSMTIARIRSQGRLEIEVHEGNGWAEYANIRIIEANKIATTDMFGKYTVKLPPGYYHIEAVSQAKNSYGAVIASVHPGERSSIDIILV